MSIKILLKGSQSETLVDLAQFKELMGVEYLSHLRFQTPLVKQEIERRTQRAQAKGKLDRKETWLGHYHSREILDSYLPDVTIAWIDEKIGYGVWTNKDIPALCSLVGKVYW